MDRDAIARARRRRQVLDVLEFEHERAAALQEQIETVVLELEGARIDDEAFARMPEEDVELVRAALGPNGGLEDFDAEEFFELGEEQPDTEQAEEDVEREEQEAEIARLEQEIATSSRRQRALERYLEALGA